MSRIRCFLLSPLQKQRESLRRYASSNEQCSQSGSGYHNKKLALGAFPREDKTDKTDEGPPKEDLRWPKTCDCGYVFKETDARQLFIDNLYVVSSPADHELMGKQFTLSEAPHGAMWWAPWYEPYIVGFDGRCLVVKTPGGDWLIDSEASNCDRKGDNNHRCWIRHGEAPLITVDKAGRETCSAGAGSILIDSYHGFLTGGYLT